MSGFFSKIFGGKAPTQQTPSPASSSPVDGSIQNLPPHLRNLATRINTLYPGKVHKFDADRTNPLALFVVFDNKKTPIDSRAIGTLGYQHYHFDPVKQTLCITSSILDQIEQCSGLYKCTPHRDDPRYCQKLCFGH